MRTLSQIMKFYMIKEKEECLVRKIFGLLILKKKKIIRQFSLTANECNATMKYLRKGLKFL